MTKYLSENLAEQGCENAIDSKFAATGDTFDDMLQQPYTDAVNCDTPKCSLWHTGGRLIEKVLNHTTNGATTENLFTFTGPVRLMEVYGVVTAIGGGGVGTDDTMDNLKLELDDGANQADITLADNGLTNNGAVGTVLIKESTAGVAMTVLEADVIQIDEGAANREFYEAIIVPKNGATNYIRVSYTGDGSTDITISWVVRYAPLTIAATLTAV